MMVRHAPVWLLLAGAALSALLLAGCRSQGAGAEIPDPEPVVRVPGALVPLELADLPAGFGPTSNNLHNDIPGYLREHDDPVLARVGERAGADQGVNRLGQGFQNLRDEEFVYVIQISMAGAEDATDAAGYIAGRNVREILAIIAPDDEELFEGARLDDPDLGDRASHFYVRHGFTVGGRRTRDVGSDLVVLAVKGTLVFIEGSAAASDDAPARVRPEVLSVAEEVARKLDTATD